MSAENRKRTQSRLRYYLTNFYPLYGGERDQVNAITPERPVKFQEILPRYSLSTSDTRDEGVGPMFSGINREVSAAPSKTGSKGLHSQRKSAIPISNKTQVKNCLQFKPRQKPAQPSEGDGIYFVNTLV